ncbi:MAG: response regulator [bacterium]
MEKIKILVIEDDQTQAMMYELAFTTAGYLVDVAYTGKQGITKAQEFKPDLIFLDMLLGDMKGQEILVALNSNPLTKDIKKVALSNLNKKEIADECYKLGVLDFLVKIQFIPKEIIEKIPGYLQK